MVAVDEVASEATRVEAWRARALLAAGYPDPFALELAAALDVDLHRACDLLAAGCPLETALAILR